MTDSVVSITNDGETFTFKQGMIEKINTTITTDIDENIIPASGPSSNFGIDINGVVKKIDIDGVLFDTDSSVSNTQNIRDKKVMKRWLEALQNGAQTSKSFTSNYENKSVKGSGDTYTITDSVSGSEITIQAEFVDTKVFVTNATFDEENANPEQIMFSLTLWVGQ